MDVWNVSVPLRYDLAPGSEAIVWIIAENWLADISLNVQNTNGSSLSK